MIQSAAILFFSRSASSEAGNKSFIQSSFKANKKIAGALIGNTLTAIKETALPFFIIDETKQSGDNFGRRLCNAVEDVFNKGYQKVVIVGNDCPQLCAGNIIAAANELHNNDFVIGPDRNGGLYLVGLTKNSFYNTFCNSIQWQTTQVFENALLYFTQSKAAYYILPALHDFNSHKDFILLKRKLAGSHAIIALVSSIIASFIPTYTYFNNSNYTRVFFSVKQLRAPPMPF